MLARLRQPLFHSLEPVDRDGPERTNTQQSPATGLSFYPQPDMEYSQASVGICSMD
jgi:hypothetical protein